MQLRIKADSASCRTPIGRTRLSRAWARQAGERLPKSRIWGRPAKWGVRRLSPSLFGGETGAAGERGRRYSIRFGRGPRHGRAFGPAQARDALAVAPFVRAPLHE